MTHPSGTYSCSHLFNAPLAELALAVFSLQYLGKAKILSALASRSLLQAHRDAPTRGMSLWLPLVFKRLHGCGTSLA